MLKACFPIALFVLLAGCVAQPVTQPIQGPKAVIDDSYLQEGRGQAHFFYVQSIDGKEVHNNYQATQNRSHGNGMVFKMTGASREVAAKEAQLVLVGQIGFAAPIQEMLYSGERYLVEGSVNFRPKADMRYLVKGKLGPGGSAIWLEDIHGQLASSIVGSEQVYAADIQGRGMGPSESNGPGSRESVREQQFASIQSGESSDAVKARLGEPERYSQYDSNYFSGREAYSTYHYDDLGDIQVRDGFVIKTIAEVKMPESLSDLEKELNVGDSVLLRKFAQNLYQAGESRQEVLDLVAQRIWDGRATEEGNTVDAMAWFCRLLGKSGNPRYRQLMTQLEQQAETRKLRRYAGNTLEELPVGGVEQFVPERG